MAPKKSSSISKTAIKELSSKAKIRKSKQVVDKYLIYKQLTQYLLNPTDELLDILTQDKNRARTLIGRTYSYFLTSPHICWYLNKYLNNYRIESISQRNMFKTFANIVKSCGINNANQFFFFKYKASEYQSFSDVINGYYELVGELTASTAEMNNWFTLYKMGIFEEQDFQTMKMIVEGKDIENKPVTSAPPLILNTINTSTEQEKSIKTLSKPLQQLIDNAKGFLRNFQNCYKCELSRSLDKIILDSNIENPGLIDILFITDYPSKGDIKLGLPFSDNNGEIFHMYFDKLYSTMRFKYAIISLVPCPVENIKDIKNFTTCVKNCHPFFSILKNQFKANLTVLVGDKVLKAFNIKGGLNKLHGKMCQGFFVMSNVKDLQLDKNRKLLEYDFTELTKHLQNPNQQNNLIEKDIKANIEYRISSDQKIDKLSREYTLFDLKVLNEQIVYILKDSNGKKKYYFEDIKIPIKIKTGEYSNCKFINDQFDYTTILTDKEKETLSKELKNNMGELTGQNKDRHVDYNS